MNGGRIVIAGAGSIGCFVGGLLSAAGRDVVLLARERMAAELGKHGLHLASFKGWALDPVPAVTTDPTEAFARAALILVTVKSGATDEMAGLIARHAPSDAKVVSLQNGLDNVERLRARLPDRSVLAGMVSFNILQLGEGRFHRGTSGPLIVEAEDEAVVEALRVPHLQVEAAADMAAVQWGKLLLNLNNALNALSGLPLRDQLLDRGWRRILAAAQEEALGLLRAANIDPWSMGPLPARWLPHVLRLPTPLFRIAAHSAVRIDPLARSSMWEDLQRGRPTEIEDLQGAIIRLAARLDRTAPIAERVRDAVRSAEHAGQGSPRLRPDQLIP